MAFLPVVPLQSTLRRHPTISHSPRRLRAPTRPRPMTCSLEPKTETSYLLETVTQPSRTSASSSPPCHDEEAQTPGIVNSTSDLDARVLFAEFLSTFIFVYLSVNAAASGNQISNSLNNAAIIAAVAASFIPVSGAHLNPAVTLALAVTNRVPLRRAAVFIPIQLAASTAASIMTAALGVPVLFPGIAPDAALRELVQAFFLEAMPMFIIVAVVFQTAVATEQEGGTGNKLAALYIGFAVLACAGTFTKGIFNPARAFGPALVARNFTSHWIFWVGPMVGAVFAAFLCEHLFLAPASNRVPNSWITDTVKWSNKLGDKIRTYGLAGLIAYGVMNTAYYGIVFPLALFRIGFAGGASSFAKAWIVTWSFSQVTKPLRLGLSLVIAPFIHRFMQSRAGAKNNKDR